ncbi:hypothetical protein [Streptomyces sp. NPDC005494]|uniref:hypothetical protein n=1 Tax=Streptomyces sp. NPDC005494 TaxID=3364715 RepID=UPI0036897CC1
MPDGARADVEDLVGGGVVTVVVVAADDAGPDLGGEPLLPGPLEACLAVSEELCEHRAAALTAYAGVDGAAGDARPEERWQS